jgi:hypothetical protein
MKESTAFKHFLTACLDVAPTGATLAISYNGSGEESERTRDVNVIARESNATGDDIIRVYDASGIRLGWFRAIWGNDPTELIADYSDNPFCNAAWDAWSAKVDA